MDNKCINLFPTYTFYHPRSQQWMMKIHGRCYLTRKDSKRRYITQKIITNLLGLSRKNWEDPVFQERINPFLAESLTGEKIVLEVEGQKSILIAGSDGHFQAEIQVERIKSNQKPESKISVRAFFLDEPKDESQIFLPILPQKATSVISDIDDTIKHTEVAQRSTLIKNTMMKPYQIVNGMDKLFHRMRSRGDFFHYVSSSPWQLYSPLMEMFQEYDLPLDSIHLREFHWKQMYQWEKLIGNPIDKLTNIRNIIDDFPDHQFILVGDVGEKDPELYYEIFSEYPGQIQKVLLRNHGEESDSEDRIHELFSKIPEEKWALFNEPAEIEL